MAHRARATAGTAGADSTATAVRQQPSVVASTVVVPLLCMLGVCGRIVEGGALPAGADPKYADGGGHASADMAVPPQPSSLSRLSQRGSNVFGIGLVNLCVAFDT